MKLRALAAASALAVTALAPTMASANTELVPRTHTLNMNIGCEQAAGAGACDTTEYWLGRNVGSNNVGNANGFTPLGYVSGSNAQGFEPDDSVNDTYILRTDKPIIGVVTEGGFATELAVDSSVTLTVTAHIVGTPSFENVTLGSETVNKAAMLPGDGAFDFSMDLDPALEGVEIDGLSVTVDHTSVNVLGSGFMDGSGGSNIRLPFYEEVES